MGEVDVALYGGGSRRIPEPPGGVSASVLKRCLLVPSFVDLSCEAGFPGFPARETPASLVRAAADGGFGSLLLSPRVDPVLDTPEQLSRVDTNLSGVNLWYAGALTRGLGGTELSECGLLQRAGAVALSDGGVPHRDTLVLRNALEYAAAFGMPVVLRPCDADLDVVGVVHDSRLAAHLGMRGNPSANEEIGIARILSLVRATGARVHVSHVGTEEGVRLLSAAQAAGLPVSASTPARNLVLTENDLDDGRYDAKFRVHPPLRGEADRAALVQAVARGELMITADHQPRAPEEKDHEFERAVPGSSGLRSAFAAAFTALGSIEVVVRGLALAPRAWLGREASGLALVDPEGETLLSGGNDALSGRRLRGAVLGFVA